MTVAPHNRMLRLRLDSATNQLQLSQTAANHWRDAKIYPNRISFKELSDMLHDES